MLRKIIGRIHPLEDRQNIRGLVPFTKYIPGSYREEEIYSEFEEASFAYKNFSYRDITVKKEELGWQVRDSWLDEKIDSNAKENYLRTLELLFSLKERDRLSKEEIYGVALHLRSNFFPQNIKESEEKIRN